MNYEGFLSGSNDKTRRHLWKGYRTAEGFFRQSLGYEMQIIRVEAADGAYFCFNGERYLKIQAASEQFGTIFHEAAHELFHSSVFHGNHNPMNRWKTDADRENPAFNEVWGEGFCEAVRWLLGKERPEDLAWRECFDRNYQRTIGMRCGKRILESADYTLAKFANLWKDLVRGYDETADYLNLRLRA